MPGGLHRPGSGTGVYVMRTSLAEAELDAPGTVRAHKDLGRVERGLAQYSLPYQITLQILNLPLSNRSITFFTSIGYFLSSFLIFGSA